MSKVDDMAVSHLQLIISISFIIISVLIVVERWRIIQSDEENNLFIAVGANVIGSGIIFSHFDDNI